MPQPTQAQVHVDAILTQMSVAYIQSRDAYVSTTVFPTVSVAKQSDKYYKYVKEDWFRDEAEIRADNTESAGSGYRLSTDGYYCDVWAFHKDIGAQMVANEDAPLNAVRDATEFVTQRLLLRQEIQWTTDFFTTGVWDTDVTGVAGAPAAGQFTQWSDYTNSNPVDDIETGKEKILRTTGYMPNTLVFGYQVLRRLKQHPDIIDRIKYTSAETVTTATLAKYFEVDRILVTRAIKTNAPESATLDTDNSEMDFVHGKHAWLGYVNSAPALMQPSAGYVFTWSGVSDGLGSNIGISRIPKPLTRSERIEGQIAWDNKVVASDMGYFFASAVA